MNIYTDLYTALHNLFSEIKSLSNKLDLETGFVSLRPGSYGLTFVPFVGLSSGYQTG